MLLREHTVVLGCVVLCDQISGRGKCYRVCNRTEINAGRVAIIGDDRIVKSKLGIALRAIAEYCDPGTPDSIQANLVLGNG